MTELDNRLDHESDARRRPDSAGFYRRVWIEKKPKTVALWEAKKALREARTESGALRYATRDWAAWVLTGEPE